MLCFSVTRGPSSRSSRSRILRQKSGRMVEPRESESDKEGHVGWRLAPLLSAACLIQHDGREMKKDLGRSDEGENSEVREFVRGMLSPPDRSTTTCMDTPPSDLHQPASSVQG